jgi:hypothetical protein
MEYERFIAAQRQECGTQTGLYMEGPVSRPLPSKVSDAKLGLAPLELFGDSVLSNGAAAVKESFVDKLSQTVKSQKEQAQLKSAVEHLPDLDRLVTNLQLQAFARKFGKYAASAIDDERIIAQVIKRFWINVLH